MIGDDGERQCVTCGATFVKGEKRYGNRPYEGYYCEAHDGKTRAE